METEAKTIGRMLAELRWNKPGAREKQSQRMKAGQAKDAAAKSAEVRKKPSLDDPASKV